MDNGSKKLQPNVQVHNFPRSGTSGVNMRNFNEFGLAKPKNKSFINKYKESKKESNSQENAQISYKRPRTNSPFPHMRINNIN